MIAFAKLVHDLALIARIARHAGSVEAALRYVAHHHHGRRP